MKKLFSVSFEVEQDKLQTIIGLLSNEVSDMSIREIGPVRKRKPNRGRARWTKAGEALLETMTAGKEYHYLDNNLAKSIESSGLSPASISSVFSELVTTGKIERIRRGTYRKTKGAE